MKKEHENGSRKRVEGAGRKPNDPELDEELSTWILLKRSENLRVTRKQIMKQALEISRSKGGTTNITFSLTKKSLTIGKNLRVF